ncbi:hypothetical protein E5S67_02840 [Microcoleus sp. IPMA8]|uniref:Uncharacterized protein n=1 Tax=Microcoleus asticus IPMA8 TaxID=2563858 RepID=A0ABX2CXJ9_9CYAN|nr:hypothetical protein [Microcoleus asticus IPMA8]
MFLLLLPFLRYLARFERYLRHDRGSSAWVQTVYSSDFPFPSPETRRAQEQILVSLDSLARAKLADLNRIGIEGKSRHYLKAQPLK